MPVCLILCLSFTVLTSAIDIPNLSYSSIPGRITITYQGSSPFVVGALTISFSLEQVNGITSVWGAPWLAWTLVSKTDQPSSLVSLYKFTSGAKLENSVINPGQTITFEYPQNPWDTAAVATQIKLTTVSMVFAEVPITAVVDDSLAYQNTITITNKGPNALETAGCILQFSYTGSSFSSVWGTPYVAWSVETSSGSNLVKLVASKASYNPRIESQGTLSVVFPGSGLISNVKLLALQAVADDSTTPPPTNSTNSTDTGNNTTPGTNPGTNTTNPNPGNNSTNTTVPGGNNSTLPSKIFVGYYESWSDIWTARGASLLLTKLPSYVNVVILSFLLPECSYTAGSYDIHGTGLIFSVTGTVLRDAITILRTNNPNMKIMAAVGGATYNNWHLLNPTAIANFVRDFGLDGVDIDYEPIARISCSAPNGRVQCTTDQEAQDVVRRIRAALPRPYLLSIAAGATGAYGEGIYKYALPMSQYTGMNLNLLRSEQGASLDFINIMTYDTGTYLNSTQAYEAFRTYFNGPVMIGVEIPPEAWGGHVLTMTELTSLTDYVNRNNGGGIMIWSLQKKPVGTASQTNPSPTMVAQHVCTSFNLGNCTAPLGV